jgi:7-carboxy-7-deazaguanine synthase
MAKIYTVKELFYTLQGEGANTGSPAVFCRFSGCNLWSGREEDRESAVCTFCDTDFVGTDGEGGGKYAAEQLADEAAAKAPSLPMLLVCTGGEPLLQLDETLINAFKERGFRVAVETNGTIAAPRGLDWVCVSPKANARLVQRTGNELKLVYPQLEAQPSLYDGLEFDHFFLQPMDGPDAERNTALAMEYCLKHPMWRLSLQTHKILGIP